MTRVELLWTDGDPARPALDVLVRLVALTDKAHEDGRLDDFWMESTSRGVWHWTADLPDDLRTTYQFCPVRDRSPRGQPVDDETWHWVIAHGEPDPAGQDRLPPGCVFGAADRPASVLSMPGAPPQPWARQRGASPAAVPGELRFGDGSVVRVQHPEASGAVALVVLFDGESMRAIGVPETVVNLQADGVVGPMTVVYVDSIRGSAARGPSRAQALTDRAGLATFVHEQLVPTIEREYDVRADPSRRVVAGHSLGGLAALHVAAADPGRFGAVAVGSAALWWPGSDSQLSGAEVVDEATAFPGRVWMEWGTEEGAELVEANRHLAQLATESGRDVRWRAFRGGHDLAVWRGSVGDGLAHLLGTGGTRTW